MNIIQARTLAHIEEARALFREYETFLGVDLCFQGFQDELAELPGKYSPPDGTLLLAIEKQRIAGCGALRKLDRGVCEMKRLFVRPDFRGRGIGLTLARRLVDIATDLGYSTMLLDTLDKLKSAIAIYEALGFIRIDPYYHNPIPGVLYWKLDLGKAKSRQVNTMDS